MMPSITSRPFGTLHNGTTVESWTLIGAGGLLLEVLTFGGIVRRIVLPGGSDVVLGFSELAPYLEQHPYFGAIVGRVAGRIPGSQFTIDGETFRLPANKRLKHLHGGPIGFDSRVWTAMVTQANDGSPCLSLRYFSPDGDQGYPGALDVTMTYTVQADNAVLIESEARTTKPTPVSIMNHSYFNLAGEGNGNVLDHELQVFASEYVPFNDNFLPVDRLHSVDASTDLREPKLLRDAVQAFEHQHGPLYATKARSNEIEPIARLQHPATGRVLECSTSAPYLQVYTGSHLPLHHVGKSGRRYGQFAGICLECEGYPNGANAPHMGSIVLRPGEVQRVTTMYTFRTESKEQ